MPIVPAICTQCGALLDVDSAKDAALCSSCDTPFVVEKAIHHYNISNGGGDSADKLYQRALDWLKLHDQSNAIRVFKEMVNKYPGDIRGWGNLARLVPSNKQYVDNALRLGDDSLTIYLAEVAKEQAEIARKRDEEQAVLASKKIEAHEGFIRSAAIACDEVRAGNGEKWVENHQFILATNPKYSTLPCVQALLKEGAQNSNYFNSMFQNICETLDGEQRLMRGDLVRAGVASLSGMSFFNHFSQFEWRRVLLIIGNIFIVRLSNSAEAGGDSADLIYTTKNVIFIHELQRAFDELINRRRKNLCPSCGNKIVTGFFSDRHCSGCKQKVFWSKRR